MNITIPIFVESRYKVNKKRIRGIVDGKMRLLSKKYKGEDKTRNVLSFSLTEGDSSYLPKEILRLGDIVISYPQVIKESAAEEMLVDDKIDQLVEHGLGHLLGMNHK